MTMTGTRTSKTIGAARATIAAMLAACACGTVFAGAQVVPLGEPDRHGYLNHSVKCDNGAKKIVQCVGGDQRCGYAGDQTLASIVEALCSGTPLEEPAGEGTPMQTSPAMP
jgi:hypothetical protein